MSAPVSLWELIVSRPCRSSYGVTVADEQLAHEVAKALEQRGYTVDLSPEFLTAGSVGDIVKEVGEYFGEVCE